MSRVIGGSSSREAYTRMLEELRQKNSENQTRTSAEKQKINSYNDTKDYREKARQLSKENADLADKRASRQNSVSGNYYDSYA